MDKARRQCDKILNDLERRVDEVYATDPSLLRITRKYVRYMDKIATSTKPLYDAFCDESNPQHKKELENAYKRKIKSLTLDNVQYNSIVSEYVRILADVNQKAIDLVNDEMDKVYAISYNQVAVDCRKVGIKVNGE